VVVLVSVGQWTTLPLAILAGVGLRHQRSCAIWVVVPLCVLSALPHKEARYMIPVMPICVPARGGGPAAVDPVQRHRLIGFRRLSCAGYPWA
jgi:hypothetical protein